VDDGGMGKINLGRLALGGLIASILMFVGDGVVHGVLLKDGWTAIMTALKLPMEDPKAGMPYHLLYDLCKGFAAVGCYVSIRPRFGAGVKTALFAGVIIWGLTIPVPLLGMIPSHFFGRMFALKWSLFALVPHLIATVAGAALYKEND
jgi:hypothetical protein